MDSLGRVWTNFARQFDDPIMRLTNSLCRTFCTNCRARFSDAFAGFRSYFSGEHVPAPQFASLGFVVSLLNLLLLNTGGNPFQTLPITISTAASSLLIYGLSSDIEQRFSSVHHARICTNIARWVMMVFGSLLMASSTSMFFPNAIQPLLYVVYMFVYAGHDLQNWRHRRLMSTTEVGGTENVKTPSVSTEQIMVGDDPML